MSRPMSLAFARAGVLCCVVFATAACESGEGGEAAGREVTSTGSRSNSAAAPRFTEVGGEVGLRFKQQSGAIGNLHAPEIMGGGVAFFDYDNDGALDCYLTNGNDRLPGSPGTGQWTSRLFRQTEDGRFEDVTAASGLGDGGYGMGVAVGDVDNDGWLDVYLANYGPDRLYRNQGDGTFLDVTGEAGIEVDGWSSSASFFDYDRDGFLDLYVARYLDYVPQKCFGKHSRDYCGPWVFPPVSDRLLHNNGDPGAPGFSDVSEAAGMTSVSAAGLGVVCEDLDDDGWPDVYVANDGHANQLWINRRDGTFGDAAIVSGAAYNMFGKAEAGMGVVVEDFDSDGHLDLFMTHLRDETNTLYRGLGNVAFVDMTGASGLGVPSTRYTGFGTAAFDVELDGDLDILVVNGAVQRGELLEESIMPPPWNAYAEPNHLYRNDGSGRFAIVGESRSSICGDIEISRGVAAGDFDRDGDIDLLIGNIEGRARLYRNDTPRAGHWVTIRAIDPALKRDAVGARITLAAGGRTWSRSVNGGSSYMSSSPPYAHFGLGSASEIDRIEVRWPDGLVEVFSADGVDRIITLNRGEGKKKA